MCRVRKNRPEGQGEEEMIVKDTLVKRFVWDPKHKHPDTWSVSGANEKGHTRYLHNDLMWRVFTSATAEGATGHFATEAQAHEVLKKALTKMGGNI